MAHQNERAAARLHAILGHISPTHSPLEVIPSPTTAIEKSKNEKPATGYESGLLGYWSNTKAIARFVWMDIRLRLTFKKALRRKIFTIADVFEDTVKQYPNNSALLYRNENFTFQDVHRKTNRVAHWAVSQGLTKGNTVALLMQNRPEFYFSWLGLAKCGIVTALINTNLLKKTLLHALQVSTAKTLIIGVEMLDAFASVRDEILGAQWQVWVYVGAEPVSKQFESKGLKSLDSVISQCSEDDVPSTLRLGVKLEDPLFYIFTSGTTGMPKPCRVSHKKIFYYMLVFGYFYRIFVALPLYHSNGGVLPLSAWRVGGSIALTRKFSASKFWDEVRSTQSTGIVYIGELCRYLNHQPEKPSDSEHSVRFMFGNGLRADIWDAYRTRFGINNILEFYGATEGNIGLINVTNFKGSCGHLPGFVHRAVRFRIIKYDVDSNQHIRDANGLCIECAPGEVGEGVAEIDNSPEKLSGNFDGYTDRTATQKKILYNVFATGDAWFRTGDLMARNSWNHFFFVDRIGDTFRWKGENVATSEVEQTLVLLPSLSEVTVYGVAIPGKDGRAGMAAVVTANDQSLDLEELKNIIQGLPVYARPLFIRHKKNIATTSTFKYDKVTLVRDGFDPSIITEPLYFLNRSSTGEQFVPLTPQLFAQISSGKINL